MRSCSNSGTRIYGIPLTIASRLVCKEQKISIKHNLNIWKLNNIINSIIYKTALYFYENETVL
jgi:hypothetical protein